MFPLIILIIVLTEGLFPVVFHKRKGLFLGRLSSGCKASLVTHWSPASESPRPNLAFQS